MSFEAYVAIGFGVFVFILLVILILTKAPKRVKREYFVSRWRKLQQRFPDKTQWAQAIIDADNLLDEALKKKRFKGSSMGERLVDAQKNFTNNDAVWFGHKLRTKIDTSPEITLRKQDVQKALLGLRQGLKDVGAL